MISSLVAGLRQLLTAGFRQYRLDLTAAGRAPMTYTVARARLRQAIADTAAGRAPGPGIIARVFES